MLQEISEESSQTVGFRRVVSQVSIKTKKRVEKRRSESACSSYTWMAVKQRVRESWSSIRTQLLLAMWLKLEHVDCHNRQYTMEFALQLKKDQSLSLFQCQSTWITRFQDPTSVPRKKTLLGRGCQKKTKPLQPSFWSASTKESQINQESSL